METRKDSATLAARGVGSTDWYFGELLAEFKPQRNSQLPTKGDALRHYLFLKRGTRMNDEQSEVIKDVVDKAKLYWDQAGITTLDKPASKPKRALVILIAKFGSLKKTLKRPKDYARECGKFDVW